MGQEFAFFLKLIQKFVVLLKIGPRICCFVKNGPKISFLLTMIQKFAVLLIIVQEFAVKCNSPRAGGVTAGIRKNLGFVQNSWKDCTLHSPSNKIQLKIALLSEDE